MTTAERRAQLRAEQEERFKTLEGLLQEGRLVREKIATLVSEAYEEVDGRNRPMSSPVGRLLHDVVGNHLPYLNSLDTVITDRAGQGVKDLKALLDTYLPSIVTGVDVFADSIRKKDRDEWTPEDVAFLAARSSLHNMLWRLAGVDAEPAQRDENYDLPSVIDLMQVARRAQERKHTADAHALQVATQRLWSNGQIDSETAKVLRTEAARMLVEAKDASPYGAGSGR